MTRRLQQLAHRQSTRQRAAVNHVPMEIAAARAKRMSDEDIGMLCSSLERSLQILRQGQGGARELEDFERASTVATTIERLGVVRGLASQITDCQLAVQSIKQRQAAGGTSSRALFATEIKALDEFCFAHRVQLSHLSIGEYVTALKRSASQLGPVLQASINRQLGDF